MPTYRVKGPDGRTFTVQAPEGASESDVLAFVASQAGAEPKAQPVDAVAEDAKTIGGGQAFAIGAGRGMQDVIQGVKQMALQSVNNPIASGALAPVAYAAGKVFPKLAQSAKDAEKAQAEQQALELESYGKLAEARPVSSTIGRITGNVAAAPLPATRGATIPATMLSGAGVGAVAGAAQYVPEGGSRTANTLLGAGVGAAIPAGLEGMKLTVGNVREVARRLKDAMPNVSQQARERVAAQMIRDAAANPQSINNMASSAIPGVQRSLAEATDDHGIAGLQRTVMRMDRRFNDEMFTQAQQNNAARVNSIREAFGGASEGAARKIEQARNAATMPILNQALKAEGVNTRRVANFVDQMIAKQDGRPEVQKAIGKVRNLLERPVTPQDRGGNALDAIMMVKGSRMSGEDFGMVNQAATLARRVKLGNIEPAEAAAALKALKPSSVTAQRAIKSARDLLGQETAFVEDIHRLYNTRKSIGDMLSGSAGADSDAARAASQQLMTIKKALDHQMKKASPEFGDYIEKFSRMSREADQVRVGAELLGKSFATLDAAGNPVLSPAQFARAMDDADALVQKSTGFRKATAERVLTDQQNQVASNVRADLDRYARSLTAGKDVGTDTVQKAIGVARVQDAAMGGNMTAPMMPTGLNGPANILNAIREHYGNKTLGIVQEMIRNPQQAQAILNKYPAAQRQQIMTLLDSPLFNQAFAGAQRLPTPAGAFAAPGAPQE